ncbi:MAG: NUDIX hydrolase [Bacteriovoracaceae bacterium]|jgi:8-oxo-dGTP pyrophosphatase MutT (NUDIX family)|nr:hypothetical protein [Halobacteriovoraceae bacterium]MDP7319073.1 NUDIX hydrolase [Bacteriovoracaceae bacterium]
MEETKYQGKFVKVTEELIEGETWERVYLNDGVEIFPITKEKKIILIKERRPHEKNKIRLKFVTGLIDNNEDPFLTANREMQEEIGLKAQNLTLLMHRESTGTINNNYYQFIATGLIPSKFPNPDGEDSIISYQAYSIDKIEEFFETGVISWGMSALAILRIKKMLENNEIMVE